MTVSAIKPQLNPLTLEVQTLLKTITNCPSQYKVYDQELLATVGQLIDALHAFCDQTTTTPTVKQDEPLSCDRVEWVYSCKRCLKNLGTSYINATVHATVCSVSEVNETSAEQKNQKERININLKKLNAGGIVQKVRRMLTLGIETFLESENSNSLILQKMAINSRLENDLLPVLKAAFPEKTFKLHRSIPMLSALRVDNKGLDIYVQIGNDSRQFEEFASKWTLRRIKAIKRALKKSKWMKRDYCEDRHVPHVKVKHRRTLEEYQIDCSNSLAYRITNLITYFFDLQPIVSRLCVYFERWLRYVKLNKLIRPYYMALMIVFYFQLKNLLPSVLSLQKRLPKLEKIGPWTGNFNKDYEPAEILDCSPSTFRAYLIEFFEFFNSFDFELHAISPYYGRVINKNELEKILPQRYVNYVSSTNLNLRLQTNTPCLIQDPFQLNYNVAEMVQHKTIERLKFLFRNCLEIVIENNYKQEEEDDDGDSIMFLSDDESIW